MSTIFKVTSAILIKKYYIQIIGMYKYFFSICKSKSYQIKKYVFKNRLVSGNNSEIQNHRNAQNDSVPAEYYEAVRSDKLHERFDDNKRHRKRGHHTDN